MEQLFRECMQRESKGFSDYYKIADYREGPVWAVPATVPGNNQVTLNWLPTDNPVNCLFNSIPDFELPEKWAEIKDIPKNLTTYTVKGLTNLKSYEFHVGCNRRQRDCKNGVKRCMDGPMDFSILPVCMPVAKSTLLQEWAKELW